MTKIARRISRPNQTATTASPTAKTKYKTRNLIERCFNKLKQFRHIATRYDRSALNYLAMVKSLASACGSGFMSPQP
jgi:transposase